MHDQLSQAFGVGSIFETSPVRIEPGSPCAGFASPSYDGGTVDPVLASGFSLRSGDQCRIQYDTVVEPSIDLPGPYRSSAFAIATDPFSGTVIDDSTDGTNTDPDGNQEPGDNDVATTVLVDIPDQTVLVDVEPVSSGQLDATGRYELEYLITIDNTGGLNIGSTRLVADLADQWDVDFDVVSVESDIVEVNDGFNGSGDSNLLVRTNEIVSGEAVEIRLRVLAEPPEDGELELNVELFGRSSTGDLVSSAPGELAVSDGPNGAMGVSWYDTLTVEEQRLMALGSAVILLFLVLFVHKTLQAGRRFVDRRSKPPIEEKPTELAPVAPATVASAEQGWYLDLRTRSEDGLVIDLSDNETEKDRHHHRARRRRGRQPQRSIDGKK